MSEPGAMVDCARMPMRLLAASCGRSWLASNPGAPPVWLGRYACHGCPAGAIRAGGVLDPMQAVRDRLAPTCPRCRRTCSRIIGQRLCVSCFNRDRELQLGRNRKGTAPYKIAKKVFACRVVALDAGAVRQIEAERASGVLELILLRSRSAKAPVFFGWAPPQPLEIAA